MKKDSNKKEFEIITIGAPIISALSKDDYSTFISCLEFQIRDYYKDKSQTNNNTTINDNLTQK